MSGSRRLARPRGTAGETAVTGSSHVVGLDDAPAGVGQGGLRADEG